MKTKNIFIQTIAMIMCVITLSLSVGGKLCVYNNISKTHAADPFTVTMGSLALEEIILGIATAILGYEVVEQYHDDIIDSFKEYAKDPSMITDPQKIYLKLMQVLVTLHIRGKNIKKFCKVWVLLQKKKWKIIKINFRMYL